MIKGRAERGGGGGHSATELIDCQVSLCMSCCWKNTDLFVCEVAYVIEKKGGFKWSI